MTEVHKCKAVPRAGSLPIQALSIFKPSYPFSQRGIITAANLALDILLFTPQPITETQPASRNRSLLPFSPRELPTKLRRNRTALHH